MQRPAIFLDKDGTVLVDVPYNVDPERMCLAPGAFDALHAFGKLGWPLIVVSNQAGVARGKFAHTALAAVQTKLAHLFETAGASLHAFYCCPHHPDGRVAPYAYDCTCRKPAPGMLLAAASEHQLDLAASWMVGDILNDVEAGRRAGCRTILVDNGGETEWQMSPWRRADFAVTDLHAAAQIIVADADGMGSTASTQAACRAGRRNAPTHVPRAM